MKILQFTEEQKGKIIIDWRDPEVVEELKSEGYREDIILEAMHIYCSMLYDEQVEKQIVPLPGDIVILTDKCMWVEAGRKAIIEGKVGQPQPSYMICFDASAFRNETVIYCSGGPSPFVLSEDLKYGGKTTENFWKWKDVPRAGGGLQYQMEVSLWYWNGQTNSQKALDLFYGK